jgi:elongation factor G
MGEPETGTRFVISVGIQPKSESDLPRLLDALHDIAKQKEIEVNPEDSAITLRGMDELHLESICELVQYQYKIDIDIGAPRIIYLETIRKSVEGEGKYIRQIGNSGNYAHVRLWIEPRVRGAGFEFYNDLRIAGFPLQYIPAIEKGIREALNHGVLAGYEIVDLTARLVDGSYHDTDSNEMAFSIAGSMAIKEATRKASPVVLEPFMSVTVRAGKEHLGKIVSDLNLRRGRIENIVQDASAEVIHALVPLSEMLRSSIHGRPEYPMRFSHYEEIHPRNDSEAGEEGLPINAPKFPNVGNGSSTANFDPDSG